MSDEQINKRIAEACGWKDVWVSTPTAWPVGTSPTGGFEKVPDYCNDFNDMHEAEKAAFGGSTAWQSFALHLVGITEASVLSELDTLCVILQATARQRAEAFLKTIGKWERVK